MGRDQVSGRSQHDDGAREPHVTPSELVGQVQRLVGIFAEQSRFAEPVDQLRGTRVLIEQLEALWLLAAADVEASGGVAASGSGSLMSWMRSHCAMTASEASARTRVAHAAAGGEIARTASAMREGTVTWRQAQVIQSAVAALPDEHRDDAEQVMVDSARSLDPTQLRRVGDRLLQCFDRESAEEAAVRRYERRGLTLAETIDGMVAVSGMLDPITGAIVMTALDTTMRPPRSGQHDDGPDRGSDEAPRDLRSWPQRRADALAEICSTWLERDNLATVGGVRPHLSVIVDVGTLRAGDGEGTAGAELAWAGPITAAETQMLGCDATVSRVLMAGPSMVLDVGRATRTIPPAIRRAVVARDRTCVASGCDRPPEHCDVHHVQFWEHGGATSLQNTVLVCRRHHRMVHQLGFRVIIDSSGRRSIGPP